MKGLSRVGVLVRVGGGVAVVCLAYAASVFFSCEETHNRIAPSCGADEKARGKSVVPPDVMALSDEISEDGTSLHGSRPNDGPQPKPAVSQDLGSFRSDLMALIDPIRPMIPNRVVNFDTVFRLDVKDHGECENALAQEIVNKHNKRMMRLPWCRTGGRLTWVKPDGRSGSHPMTVTISRGDGVATLEDSHRTAEWRSGCMLFNDRHYGAEFSTGYVLLGLFTLNPEGFDSVVTSQITPHDDSQEATTIPVYKLSGQRCAVYCDRDDHDVRRISLIRNGEEVLDCDILEYLSADGHVLPSRIRVRFSERIGQEDPMDWVEYEIDPEQVDIRK